MKAPPPTSTTSTTAGLDGTIHESSMSQLNDYGRSMLATIERSVQDPPMGTFTSRALLWVLQRRARRGKYGKNLVVQQCYIPTSRVPDFVAGMQSGKDGAQCVFRETKEKPKVEAQERGGPRTALHFSRYTTVHICSLLEVFIMPLR